MPQMTYQQMSDLIKRDNMDAIAEAQIRILYFIQNAQSINEPLHNIYYLNNNNALVNLKHNSSDVQKFMYSQGLTQLFIDRKNGQPKPCFENFHKSILAY